MTAQRRLTCASDDDARYRSGSAHPQRRSKCRTRRAPGTDDDVTSVLAKLGMTRRTDAGSTRSGTYVPTARKVKGAGPSTLARR